MNRVEFTKAIAELLTEMCLEDEHPLGDWWLRNAQVQKLLFDAKLSKCDGYVVKSAHQSGTAIDIYFIEDNKMVEPKKSWEYWHKKWEEKGGKPMIEWDKGHFEG